jgi:cytochrome c peroxidase
MRLARSAVAAVMFGLLIAALHGRVMAFPVDGDQTALPANTELNEDALTRPREVFRSELTGRKSYLVNLGNLAFGSPSIMGGVARQANISCGTCHVNGAGNAKLFIPKMSTRPGNFDTTGPLFNPRADNGLLDPVRIPSLRGARYLAPYGADGRMASLRDFVHNVIVNEFAGAEPQPVILDAIVAYIQDIDFLPNPSLGPGGRLVGKISDSERRGEALFSKPFPHDASLSCAACHVPSGAFVDHAQHDVGSGGLFKTPTLLNADFNAPYFHDGRYDSYDQVVAHFDRVFDLGLSPQDHHDLVAYLTAVGDGERPYERDGVGAEFKEIGDFASVLDTAIPAHDTDIIALAVDTVDRGLRELTEQFPDYKDASVAGGQEERRLARSALKDLVLRLSRIDLAASAGQFDDAATEYRNVRNLSVAAVPALLRAAQPWSLFNPAIHDAHYGALRQMLQTANQ